MNPVARKLILFSIALDIVIFDQISKWGVTELIIRPQLDGEFTDLIQWVLAPPARLPFAQIEILPFFNVVMVWNQGISFGMFSQGSDYASLLLIILPLVITAIFTIWVIRTKSLFQGLSLALVIGGAIGNVIDRLRFGAVIDFLDFHVAGIHYPAFNLADSCVVIGIGLLIVYSLFFEKEHHA